MNLFWTLPGPRRFLAQVEAHLRAGRSVVLRFPALRPAGLRRVARQLASDWAWREVSTAAGAPPADVLYDAFVPRAAGERVRNARSFAADAPSGGAIAWLDRVEADTWPRWRDFLEAYTEACRNKESSRRLLFVVLLEGGLALDPPRADLTLAHCSWRGVVSELDALLYAGILLQERAWAEAPPPPRQLVLLASVAAKVALWDPWLARALAAAAPREILAPGPLLQQEATRLGWGTGTPPQWEAGSEDCVDGAMRTHSALLAIQGRTAEIDERLWSAQAGILLPLVEEHRRALLARVAPSIPLPQRFDTGPVDRLEDLEIGHLAHLSHDLQFGRRTSTHIRWLRDIRNRLSHLEPLDPSTALSAELYEVG